MKLYSLVHTMDVDGDYDVQPCSKLFATVKLATEEASNILATHVIAEPLEWDTTHNPPQISAEWQTPEENTDEGEDCVTHTFIITQHEV